MSTLNKMLEMDHEVGKATSPPKLLKAADYFWWKERFEAFSKFHDIKMWLCIEDGYVPPTQEVEGKMKVYSYHSMKKEDKEVFEAENRALSCLKMCLPMEILHTFKNCTSSKHLWEALERRYAGNDQVRKGRTDLLKKQFAVFKHMKAESLEEIITRYYHLMTELDSHNVKYTDAEKIDKLLDALPPKWEFYSMLMKNDEEKYSEMTLEDVIGKLRAYDFQIKKKEMAYDQVQDPGSYFGKPSSSSSTTGGVSAFLSGTSEHSTIMDSDVNCFVTSSGVDDQGTNSTKVKSTQGHQNLPISLKSTDEQLSVLALFITSYENYIKGKINDPAI